MENKQKQNSWLSFSFEIIKSLRFYPLLPFTPWQKCAFTMVSNNRPENLVVSHGVGQTVTAG